MYNHKPRINVKHLGQIKTIKTLINHIEEQDFANILIETYPGVDLEQINKQLLLPLNSKWKIIWSEDYALKGEKFRQAILPELTNDRVFGKITHHQYRDYFIKQPILWGKKNICYGIGASYLMKSPDLIIYLDLPRWEIQKRYRENKKVFFGQTLELETSQNFKRGYFIEWRMADKIKQAILPQSNYYIDTSTTNWKIITRTQLFDCLNYAAQNPFRLVPYFDAGIWGGQWMSKKFNLGPNKFNRWAWGFDGVPEENALCFSFSNGDFLMPALNLVFFEPLKLLGEHVFARFGAEFPIRFDFLDTIKGQNLSLQVHPNKKYIKENFNVDYAQEESYYILDVDPEAKPVCYLGTKTGIKKEKFIEDLRQAQVNNDFDAKKYINTFPVKKHDHFLHPAGVVHASGAGAMVLEISATPYIFTFKLWDWKRLDLDLKPRPINIEHGKNVIDYRFDTNKTSKELVNNFKLIYQDQNYLEEKTGLHKLQFIETRRFRLKTNEKVLINNHQSVNMLNLVQGKQIIVKSQNNAFKPLIINYAETFIVPSHCKQYLICPIENNQEEIILLQSFVRK